MPIGDDVQATREEGELHWYFGLDLPPVPGLGSSFGVMCGRLAMRNAGTRERPTEGVSWTERVAVRHGGAAGTNDVEDAVIAHLDGQRRARVIRAALMRLTAVEYGALQARYGGAVADPRLAPRFGDLAGVALLTERAYGVRVERAVRDEHATLGDSLAELVATVMDSRAAKGRREAARGELAAIRREALGLAERALAAYVRARRGAR